jgi:hypothetical protein
MWLVKGALDLMQRLPGFQRRQIPFFSITESPNRFPSLI